MGLKLLLKKIYVKWVDSSSTDEWTYIDQIDVDEIGHVIETTGFLIFENKASIIVALNYDSRGKSVSCFIQIPKVVIKERKYI